MSHSRALSLVGGGDPDETYNLMENSVYELYNHEWQNWWVIFCAKKIVFGVSFLYTCSF